MEGLRRKGKQGPRVTVAMPLSTIGDGAFPVAASRVWNSLPLTVTSLQSLPVFKRQLKSGLCCLPAATTVNITSVVVKTFF